MRLSQVCDEIFAGGDVPKNVYSKIKTSAASVPIYTNGEKNKGLYGYSNIARVTKPSITISARGTIGYAEIRTEKFYPAIRLIVVTPNCDIVDLSFLKYVISGIDFKSSGTSIPQLTVPMIKEYEIPLPPLFEQKQIVAILDKAFSAIDRAEAIAEQNLRNARELFDSYLNEIFTKKGKDWEEDALGNLFEIKPPKQQVKEKLKPNAKVSFLPMEDLNVLTRTVTANKERTLSEVYTGYTYFETDDVLLAKITPCFENGKLGLAKNLTNNTGFGSSEYIVFRQNGRVIPELLYYFLSRNSFREDGKQHMKGAVGHKRVEKEFVETYKMPYPKNKTEQIQFVRKFDLLSGQCSQLEKIYQQKIDNLEELKKSILQRAFAGELTTAPQAIPA